MVEVLFVEYLVPLLILAEANFEVVAAAAVGIPVLGLLIRVLFFRKPAPPPPHQEPTVAAEPPVAPEVEVEPAQAEAVVAAEPPVIPEVEGTAHITGRHSFLMDPADPLKNGFIFR